MGIPMWAAAARTRALFAATASKWEIIGRNFTWESVDSLKRFFLCQDDLHVAEKKGRRRRSNFAETSNHRHYGRNLQSQEINPTGRICCGGRVEKCESGYLSSASGQAGCQVTWWPPNKEDNKNKENNNDNYLWQKQRKQLQTGFLLSSRPLSAGRVVRWLRYPPSCLKWSNQTWWATIISGCDPSKNSTHLRGIGSSGR